MYKYFGLYRKALKETEKKHKELFDSLKTVFLQKISNFFSDRKNWFWIFALVFVSFVVPYYVDCDKLNVFNVTKDTSRILVDQRTTNIATIISISLVVVGFLINNLAVKSPITYRLLFKNSLLYLTIYLTLSTIFCFIILSTLRDTIPEDSYPRMVVAGTYLSLFILFLIGLLFRKIIYFTNEQEISKMLSEELITEGRQRLKMILIKKYSSEIYKSFMEVRGVEQIKNDITLDMFLNSTRAEDGDLFENGNFKTKFLTNINLSMLSILIRFNLIQNYDPISIGSEVNLSRFDIIKINSDNFNKTKEWLIKRKLLASENDIFSKFSDRCNTVKKWLTKKCFTFSKKNVLSEVSDDYKKEFENRIFQLAEESKYKNLSQTLNAYLELYKLQMLNQK